MAFGMLSRWKPRHLLGAWSAWWAGLAAATLGPAARAVWEVTHLPDRCVPRNRVVPALALPKLLLPLPAELWT